MPWARIPPDKLINLPLFGIDVIQDDGDFVWMRGARGRMRIDKRNPRVWFESVSDAHQAGAASIRISSAAEEQDHIEIMTREASNTRDPNATDA